MDHDLVAILWIMVAVVVLDLALVLSWVREDRKKARERRAILDGLER